MIAGFPRQARVRASAEFDQVFKHGRRTASPLFALHLVADARPARLGLAVSRKVDPHAVGRNRIKRVLRDAFRHLRPQLDPGAYVIVARREAASTANALLRTQFIALLQRAGALPLPDVLSTIAAAAMSPLPVTASESSGGSSLPA